MAKTRKGQACFASVGLITDAQEQAERMNKRRGWIAAEDGIAAETLTVSLWLAKRLIRSQRGRIEWKKYNSN